MILFEVETFFDNVDNYLVGCFRLIVPLWISGCQCIVADSPFCTKPLGIVKSELKIVICYYLIKEIMSTYNLLT